MTDTRNIFISILKFISKFTKFEFNDEKISNALKTTNFDNLRRIETEENFEESVSIMDEVNLILQEGGAYGHMAHPYDDMDLTFGDLKQIIDMGLQGNLSKTISEKLDGQAISISWKNGKLIAARNKGHLKNQGAAALDVSGLKSMFAGRGHLTDAFGYAVEDLEKAISKVQHL